jgi:hypothetical protein
VLAGERRFLMSAQKHDANRDFIGFAEYPSFAEILSSERLISLPTSV